MSRDLLASRRTRGRHGKEGGSGTRHRVLGTYFTLQAPSPLVQYERSVTMKTTPPLSSHLNSATSWRPNLQHTSLQGRGVHAPPRVRKCCLRIQEQSVILALRSSATTPPTEDTLPLGSLSVTSSSLLPQDLCIAICQPKPLRPFISFLWA